VELLSAFEEEHLLDCNRASRPEARAGVLLARVPQLIRVLPRLQTAARSADVVQVNLPTPSFALVGDLIQHLLRRPIVVGFEAHLPTTSELFGPRIVEAPAFYLPQILINNDLVAHLSRFQASSYVVASQFQAAELGRLGVPTERTSVIPNLVDVDHLRYGEPTETTTWPDRGPVISYVGHFSYVKGVDLLIRAIPDILDRFPTTQIVLAWSGLGRWEPIRRAIDAAGVDDHIHVLGRVPVASVLRRSAVCVLPYRLTVGQAAYPDLILEAFTIGVPLVTADLPLIQELVTPGQEAELAQPEVPASLASCIVSLLGDPERRRRMVASQRDLMRTRCSPDSLVARYEATYGQCIAVGHRG
jgi:glycosyltransferase involved in cell wall biosynthesis